MKLFFTGCSFTRGNDLENPNLDSWPALIATQKNLEFTNNAVSGASNERIVYQIVKNIDLYDKFYIAWSSVDRFTRYRYDNNFEVSFNPELKNALYQNTDEFDTYGKIHYAYWHNNLYAFKLWLHQIILVQSFLERKNKKYLMLNAFPNNIKRWTVDWKNFNNSVNSLLCFDVMNDQQLYDEHVEIQKTLSQINFDHFIGWSDWNISDFVKPYEKGPTGHPLQFGHQQIADYIIKHDTN